MKKTTLDRGEQNLCYALRIDSIEGRQHRFKTSLFCAKFCVSYTLIARLSFQRPSKHSLTEYFNFFFKKKLNNCHGLSSITIILNSYLVIKKVEVLKIK